VPETALRVGRVQSLPFGENTYIAQLDGRNDCIVIDPGFEPDPIFEYLDRQSLTPAAIVCTHGHSDHIAGNAAIKNRWPDCPIVIGEVDAEKLTNPVTNMSAVFGFHIVSPPADRTLREGERFEAAGIGLDAYDTPGHSTGHIVLVCKHVTPWQVFSGDILFEGGIGRYDLPGGSFETLRKSIHDKLFTLPDDTILLPGHGPETTVGHQKRTNPYVGEPAGFHV
jgi:glyoxylase-like metal-dependent hydrolase (beta-lactamase superfamily II)